MADTNELDVFSPHANKSHKGIHDVVSKVYVQKAPYVIVRLEPNGQSVTALAEYFKKHPVEGLKQLFVIQNNNLYIIH